MKVALVYDRVNKWGGAERVLLALHELFPEAPLYTSVYNSQTAPWAKVFPKVITSFLQRLPLAKERHDFYAPLMPLAFESFDFSEYDLVISVTSEAAKGIITKPGTLHICYCLTPTRYLWSGYDFYFGDKFAKRLATPVISYLRWWDKIAAQRPDVMLAISQNVASRIRKYYGRKSRVIYPSVDTKQFRGPDKISSLHSSEKKGEYFLVVSRLVPYKRVDLVIEVFNRLSARGGSFSGRKWPLVIVGTGSEERKLHKMAGKNIRFVEQVDDGELAKYYQGCKALIFPQEEDFGIVAVESQALGKPVIAYRGGGALETVVDGKSGIFFDRQTPESLALAIKKFDRMSFDENAIKGNAKKFSKEKFLQEFATLVST